MRKDCVVLVDEEDNEIGVEEKLAAHKYPGKLHRAFSIFILNKKGQLLIQKRNHRKITWPGFWSNSCCSHPRPNEPIKLAAQRRLEEELGFTCEIDFLFKFKYPSPYQYSQNWGEYEIDHVFLGYHNGSVNPHPEEVDGIKFVNVDELQNHMKANKHVYTPWLIECFDVFIHHIEIRQKEANNVIQSLWNDKEGVA